MISGHEWTLKYIIIPVVSAVAGIVGFFMRKTITRLDNLEASVHISREDIKVLEANYKDILKHIESTERKLDRMEEKTDRKLDSLRDILVKDLLERRNDKK